MQTNVMQYPKIMQPTHARWKQLPASSKALTPGRLTASQEVMSLAKEDVTEVSAQGIEWFPNGETIFPQVTSVISRNFMVADVCYVSPPVSGLGNPGPEDDISDIGPGALSQVPQCIRAELPVQCRQAFDGMRVTETMWKAQWGVEAVDRARGQLRISYNN
jgi:chromatin structure-remodeling complex protein RSC7